MILFMVPLLLVWAIWLAWQGRWTGAGELTALAIAIICFIGVLAPGTKPKTKIAWSAALTISILIVALTFYTHPGMRLD